MTYKQYITSPQGMVEVCANEKGITAITFVDKSDVQKESGEHIRGNAITQEGCDQLTAYFNKRLSSFDLPLNAMGTDFQKRVWQALLEVPYGQTASYADIATAIENPKSVRAVGMANGRNPVAIVVPCHRIIGSNKTLTGYAGGLERKQYLLNLEGAQGVLWL